jgi:excisionase family DNA binding protein
MHFGARPAVLVRTRVVIRLNSETGMKSEEVRQKAFDGRQLTSWKEVAAYLGVSVRTAQKWEHERGLPVRRLPGGRGMVLVSVAEIEAWMRTEPQETAVGPNRPWLLWLGGVAVAGLSALGVRALTPRHEEMLTDFRLEGEYLVALNGQGKELWRHALRARPVNTRFRHQLTQGYVQTGWIGDIDGDGQNELLYFPILDGRLVPEESSLYCFSSTGKIKWQFVPGSAAAAFPADHRPPYQPANLMVFGPVNQRTVVLASVHHTWFPCQVAVLNGRGELRKEYWHSGHLLQLSHVSKGNNGGELILAGGVSNGYKTAALVALDPGRMEGMGCSIEESQGHQLPGARANEAARVLFPRSRISLRKGPYNMVSSIRVLPDAVEVAVAEDLEAGAEVIHTFGRQLDYVGAGLSSNYLGRHAELEQLGLLRGPVTKESELTRLSEVRWLRRMSKSS